MSSVPELILLLVKVVQVLGARGWWQWSYAEDEARFMSHCTRRAKTKRRKAWIIGGWLDMDKRGGSVGAATEVKIRYKHAGDFVKIRGMRSQNPAK